MSNDNDKNIASKIKFSDITIMLEKISKAKTPSKKAEILEKYIVDFKNFSKTFKQQHGDNSEASFFPVLRLLIPTTDYDRSSYGIKTTTMGRLYVRILGIDTKSKEAKQLTSNEGFSNDCTDYADVVYKIMKNRCRLTSQITVLEVNQCLDAIADHHINNRKKIDDELIKMIDAMTAIDQKWIIRIILKNLHLGIGQQRIFSAYHPLAKAFYAQFSNLSAVCSAIESGDKLPEAGNIEPFHPVKPMLCERIQIRLLENIMKQREFFLETKMDGERFQLHIDKEEYKYFSRNCFNYSHIFGSNFAEGSLTPFIHKLFLRKIKNIILDGEMMVWNKEEKIYHVKGENYDVKNIKRNDSIMRPAFCVYDVLYLNDENLIKKPYVERIRLLRTLFREQTGVLVLCPQTKIKDSNHIMECLNGAIEAKEEGVVIKDQDSFYRPGERTGGWYKIKPDYVDGLVSDFDLLVIGGYFNKQRNFIDSFLLAVYDKNRNVFLSVAKVSSGLAQSQWEQLNNSLKEYWNVIKKGKTRQTSSKEPSNIEWGKAEPDVWIEPKNSIILEVKASELVKTSTFRTNYTLRFPRIISIRSDKPWEDCCSLEELEKLCTSNSSVEKLTKRYITSDDISAGVHSNRKGPPGKKFKRSSAPIVGNNSNDDIKNIDNICHDLEFCVLSTSKNKPTVSELEKIIQRHGGRIVKTPRRQTFAIVAGILTLTVKKYAEKKEHNIVKVDWLLRATGGREPRNELMPFHPNDMIFATEELRDKFIVMYDKYSDSFTDHVESTQELKAIIDKIDLARHEHLTRPELIAIEKEIFGVDNVKNFFRSCIAFFVQPEQSNMLKLSELVFKSRQGCCVENCRDQFVTHVIVDKENFDENIVKDLMTSITGYQPKIVTFNWILESDKDGHILDESNYVIAVQ